MVRNRWEIQRHADRAVPEKAAGILMAGRVAHVAFTEDGQPFAIPFGYQYDAAEPNLLYIHGSHASRALAIASSGAPLCITVTLLDGLVFSRTALNHSMNYRSVVCFGRGREVTDPETQKRVYEAMVTRYFPGRTLGQDYAAPTAAHLASTRLVEVAIDDWSAKAREGGPTGPLDLDEDSPGTCGVVPL
jgi:nitroimidazol reductase NimA-like FMN-containing flavoprotein (pyridoxamine 5'-phosphate oxidase superfamily)